MRGFTLIEVLIVLLIMGLSVGMVSAIMQPDDRSLLRVEADRLAQLLDLAATEARFTGNTVAWTSDTTGYRFWRKTGESGWSEVRDSDVLRGRTLPQGITVTRLQIENTAVRNTVRLEFVPYAAPLAFTIHLSLGSAHCAVTASPIGEIEVVPDAGETRG